MFHRALPCANEWKAFSLLCPERAKINSVGHRPTEWALYIFCLNLNFRKINKIFKINPVNSENLIEILVLINFLDCFATLAMTLYSIVIQ